MKNMQEKKSGIEIYNQLRQDPKTGKVISGKFLWTPDEPTDLVLDDLYCNPEPTELIKAPDLSPNTAERTRQGIGMSIEPTLQEVNEFEKPEISVKALSDVCRRYYRGCTCGHSYENNCAHFLSNAFILAGYRDLLNSPLITHRCAHGRPTRARDMLRWFQAKQNGFYGARVQRNTGVWATYQEKPGWSHVVIIDANAWVHYGTGDYWDWNLQWNYRIP